MSSGGNLDYEPSTSSAATRTSSATSRSRDMPHQSNLYEKVEVAKKQAISLLKDPSNWPKDTTIAVQELLEIIHNVPNLQEALLGETSVSQAMRESIEQFAKVMEDVCARLKKTHKKYGSKRDFSNLIRSTFGSRSKDGCNTALKGCYNEIDKALSSLRDHLAKESLTQKNLLGKDTELSQVERNVQVGAGSGDAPFLRLPNTQADLLNKSQEKAISAPQPGADKKGTQHESASAHGQPEPSPKRRIAMLKVARTTFGAVEAVSGAIPVVGSYVGAGAKVGLAIVDMMEAMDSNAEAAEDLESHTKRLSELLGPFEKQSVEHQREYFGRHIGELQSELQYFQKKVKELQSVGTARKFFSSADHAGALQGWKEAIQTALEELQLPVNINTTNLLNELYDAGIQRENRRLLDRLGDASYGARGNAIEDVICLPGTRVEVLERIDEWIRDPSSERVLWIRGMAGRGKSTIASTVAYNWRYRAPHAIFHFRRGQNALDQRLVCSLARQLGSSVVPEVREAILQSIRENEDIGQERLQEQFKVLFAASAKTFQAITHHVLVIVDALDECEDNKYAVDFLDLVHQYASSFPTNFKFLFTTRPEHPLLHALERRSWRTEDLDTIPTIDRDITQLLQRRFSVIREENGLGDDWPPETSIQSLVGMSQGLFQWHQENPSRMIAVRENR